MVHTIQLCECVKSNSRENDIPSFLSFVYKSKNQIHSPQIIKSMNSKMCKLYTPSP